MNAPWTTPAAQPCWSSDHVFISPGQMSDLFIVQCLAPFLRERPGVKKWFFIRYGEGGPHVRVRLDVTRQEAADAARDYWRAHAPSYVDGDVAGPEWGARSETVFEPGSVERIDYEPETERYGGPRVMAANERLFCHSTALAIGIIAATLNDFERRIGQAVKIMIASARALDDEPKSIGALLRSYAAGWERFLRPVGWTPEFQPVSLRDTWAIHAALGENAFASRSYSSVWRAGLDGLLHELEKPEHAHLTARKEEIVMSHMHMFCNRLGVSPSMEFHIASQIGSAL